MNTRTPTPIESFGSDLFNALIQGSKQRFVIPDIPYRDAVKFRMRCHKLRHRMREENHPLAPVAAKTRITIDWDHSKIDTLFTKKRVAYPKSADALVTLTIEPHDSEFTAALKAAGLDLNRRFDTQAPTEGRSEGDVAPTEGSIPSIDKLLGEM